MAKMATPTPFNKIPAEKENGKNDYNFWTKAHKWELIGPYPMFS